ncbi:DEAD/DEAH box helicase [Vibrio breoganii]|uniref:DEAD/DEAH box helicase family protein n=1 Tax=Vibrio breoganii TaxID=553239 RepID=UPI000C8567DA|nr:DEAD/DEAH box helicase family protein [Vibrio breoganii]PML39513.1 DEAD/DEAH box helicase [Vibrio breoganii]
MPNTQLNLKENILTTGGDDPLLDQLLYAINHATEIDIAVSFIQSSGLQLILPAIQEAIERSHSNAYPLKLRVLTSDYLGITDPVALRALMALSAPNVELRIFESNNHSFHIKSYIFVRSDKENTFYHGSAFVGSNNISRAALTNAHEWCIRFDHKEPQSSFEATQFQLIRKEFDKIFSHQNSIDLSDSWIDSYIARRQLPKAISLVSDAVKEPEETYTPNNVQMEALEALQKSRSNGYTRGLVVLGTGMGKTWLSAFDAMQLDAKRTLFVAHREEILTQALNTYTKLWPQKSAGYFNSFSKATDKQMLFASVQTLGKEHHLATFDKDHFDYIVIDEFHHARAQNYLNILQYFEPKFLLGLTATPERTDQADILSLCNNNLVFERNLVHGINQGILAPFHYYGIWDDTLDYQEIPWRNGTFDPNALDAEFATTRRAQHIFKHWEIHQQSKTLAFCISVKHCDYMAEQFNKAFNGKGYKAVSVHSQSEIRRNEALTMLGKGEIQILFSVDLFNEGTDLPSIDTILMIRPTQSNIIFLQQLGRGLRTSPNKSHVVVLDFLGNHKSFLSRNDLLQIPLTGTNNNAIGEEKGHYGSLTELGEGCHINIDPEVINFWTELKKRFKNTAREEFEMLEARLGHRPTATEFFHHGYDLKKVNKQHGSWLEFVSLYSDSKELKSLVSRWKTFFLTDIQETSRQKSYKPILLEALIELDGFRNPPTLDALAEKSWHVLKSYPRLYDLDLPEEKKEYFPSDKKWLNYWKGNPIKAYTTKNTGVPFAPFKIEDNVFKLSQDLEENDILNFQKLVKELVDYRLAEYTHKKLN